MWRRGYKTPRQISGALGRNNKIASGVINTAELDAIAGIDCALHALYANKSGK